MAARVLLSATRIGRSMGVAVRVGARSFTLPAINRASVSERVIPKLEAERSLN